MCEHSSVYSSVYIGKQKKKIVVTNPKRWIGKVTPKIVVPTEEEVTDEI